MADDTSDALRDARAAIRTVMQPRLRAALTKLHRALTVLEHQAVMAPGEWTRALAVMNTGEAFDAACRDAVHSTSEESGDIRHHRAVR